jgi:hypothetical protein
MNIFNILGYVSDKTYSKLSKTNVGEFALVVSGAPAANSNFFLLF